jgi:hypothetical protein
MGNGASSRTEETRFFTKMLHFMQHFCEKRSKCTTLPQAKTAFVDVHV